MNSILYGSLPKTDRIGRMIHHLYEKMPEIEADRARLLTESYRMTEGEPVITRRALAYEHICRNLPVTIRPEELIAGSATIAPRGCQVFPEFSCEWMESEFETIATRSADPFFISEKTKEELRSIFPYWKGKTTSELASSYMADETKLAMEHNIFTPGNYFYNGVGHVTVKYEEVLEIGFDGIREKAEQALSRLSFGDSDYQERSHFLKAVIIICNATVEFAKRYARLAVDLAAVEKDRRRKMELIHISQNCSNVPARGAESFMEACQSFWFVQLLLQIESNGHSISPGRFDQYMYPYYKADIESGLLTIEQAQEYLDCIWVKLNDLNKARDEASAEGFAGYSLFQNLIVGGQDENGTDVTNELSYHCIESSHHVFLPMPSLSVRVWNNTPQELLIKAAGLTRTGIGLPAYYNDEVIIPSLMNRGITLADARNYNIIGCVEPQKAGKTEGWHDAAFFNMCRPLELVFSNGMDQGVQIGPKTGTVESLDSYEKFFAAYQQQMEYMISLLVNADNAIDLAHAKRCPLPLESALVDDCIERGKSLQEGGAVYNFTGPQGFGVANMANAFYAVKKLVYEEKKFTLLELKDALDHNFGYLKNNQDPEEITRGIVQSLTDAGKVLNEEDIRKIAAIAIDTVKSSHRSDRDREIQMMLLDAPKFGNDIPEVDFLAREVAYTYTRPMEKYKNPRGGQFQAGLYPVSANVPLGAQTGATPDGRLAYTPVADGVSPSPGTDVNGPTAAANSVARLDHSIASNGTLYNMKFHPSALEGRKGLENFVSMIRGYFDQKGMHVQFNVVSRETLLDAQKNPQNYQNLVVRVAGYSALFTTLSKSLQDDIISRTEQGF